MRDLIERITEVCLEEGKKTKIGKHEKRPLLAFKAAFTEPDPKGKFLYREVPFSEERALASKVETAFKKDLIAAGATLVEDVGVTLSDGPFPSGTVLALGYYISFALPPKTTGDDKSVHEAFAKEIQENLKIIKSYGLVSKSDKIKVHPRFAMGWIADRFITGI